NRQLAVYRNRPTCTEDGRAERNVIMQRIQTGQIIGGAMLVLTVHQDKYILCRSINANPYHTYGVMSLDIDGVPFGGRYFSKKEDAEQLFAAMCFPQIVTPA
ncbi:MAG: hypothetical protein RR900_02105, partial [Ruthenibacterium sp.]